MSSHSSKSNGTNKTSSKDETLIVLSLRKMIDVPTTSPPDPDNTEQHRKQGIPFPRPYGNGGNDAPRKPGNDHPRWGMGSIQSAKLL